MLTYFQNIITYYPLGNTLHNIPVIFNFYVKLADSTSSSHAICYSWSCYVARGTFKTRKYI